MSAITSTPNPVRVMNLFKYCQQSFMKNGVRLDFPKNTNPENTYQWRYLSSFINRMDEYNVPDVILFRIIDEIIKLAKKRKLLYKGLSLLNTTSLVLEACDIINNSESGTSAMLDTISSNHLLVSGEDPLEKDSPKSFPNLIKWYMRGEVSELYIAISKKCCNAITKMDVNDKLGVPDWRNLFNIRMKINSDKELSRKIVAIMGADFNNL